MWVQQEVLAAAATQIGYRPGGPEQGKFCDWYGRRANWCVMGMTWAFYKALGEHAKNVIGVQPDAPNGRGWSWTVGLREWLQKNGTKVNIRDAKCGDIAFFKYPTTGDRGDQIVNHVEPIESQGGGWFTTIGFNTAEPGKADILTNRGVYRVTYSVTNSRLVDVYRPPYDRFPGIGYIPFGRTAKEIQEVVAVTPSGVYDENTRKGVELLQKKMGIEADGLWGPGTNAAFDAFDMAITNRLSGPDRYSTAVAVSKAAWTRQSAQAVYLVRGNNFPDALAVAGSLQPGSDLPPGPVLLVRDTLPEVVRAEIARLKPAEIFAVGGDDVVPNAVLEAAKRAAAS